MNISYSPLELVNIYENTIENSTCRVYSKNWGNAILSHTKSYLLREFVAMRGSQTHFLPALSLEGQEHCHDNPTMAYFTI
jgi:hypothetical protein